MLHYIQAAVRRRLAVCASLLLIAVVVGHAHLAIPTGGMESSFHPVGHAASCKVQPPMTVRIEPGAADNTWIVVVQNLGSAFESVVSLSTSVGREFRAEQFVWHGRLEADEELQIEASMVQPLMRG